MSHESMNTEKLEIQPFDHESKHDPMQLKYLTSEYALLQDADGKEWRLEFGNNEWIIEDADPLHGEPAVEEKPIIANKNSFKNKEEAFMYLKKNVFKNKIMSEFAILKKHGLDTKINERIQEILNRIEEEVDESKKNSLFLEANDLYEQEA